jgi:CHAT domain-containing protein
MYRWHSILTMGSSLVLLALTGLVVWWAPSHAAYASENKSSAELIDAARPLLQRPELTAAGMQELGAALDKVDLQNEADRRALSALASDLASPSSQVSGLSLPILRVLAQKDASARDVLVDRFSRILARYIAENCCNVRVGLGDDQGSAQFLIIVGDSERQRQNLRVAALLYEKAIDWGADEQIFNNFVRDWTPTRTKLADCIARLGGGTGGDHPLEAPTATRPGERSSVSCGPTSRDDLARLLAQARSELAQHDARASLMTIETMKSVVGSCKDADVNRDLLFNAALALRGRAYWALGDTESAIRAFHDFADGYEKLLDLTLLSLSESMARIPYLSMSESVDSALSFLAGRIEPAAGDIAVQLLASRVGRLYEMQGDRSRLYRHAGPAGAQILRWQATRATLLLRGGAPAYEKLLPDAKLPHNLSIPPGTPPAMEAIGELEFAEDQLGWALLGHRATGFSIQPISIANIQAAIRPDMSILLYAVIPKIDPWNGSADTGAEYIRWTLTSSGIGAPARVGTTQEIDTRVEQYLGQVTHPGGAFSGTEDATSTGVRGASRPVRVPPTSMSNYLELSALLLPSAADLLTTKTLGVIADGALFRVPFAALSGAKGQPLVTHMSVFNVQGPRSLAWPVTLRMGSERLAKPTQPVLLGDPLDDRSSARFQAQYATPAMHTAVSGALPGSRSEVQSIARILGGDLKVLVGADATETAVKSLTSPLILHLATHGQYLTTVDPVLSGFELSRATPSGLSASAQRLANPWIHSYLALAEYSTLEPLDRDDGVLTDLEVLGLDLDGTSLAVASACESGVGPIETGSGIYSLRAAFAMAGAKSQVVSLWEVDDLGTRAFMEFFYARLRAGASTLDAFADAQRALASGSQFADPYYWAAFTISGENVVIWPTAPH